MTHQQIRIATTTITFVLLGACGGSARLPVSAGIGPNPQIAAPEKSLIPVVNVKTARGWSAGVTPTAASGLAVRAYAMKLEHPRFIYVLPNGDVLVSESNGPPRPEDEPGGIRGWFMKRMFKRAGAAVPSPDKIILLRDTDGDGVAETRSDFLDSLHSPFGITLVGSTLYVANTDALVAFPYREGELRISAAPRTITALPGRPYNHHWTKSLIASADGSKLYVGVGSNSNAAERGIDAEKERAAIWEIDAKTGTHRIFASGLRNPVGLAWEPQTDALWVSVNERDELGNDLVPDYMTHVREGAFYGWPYSYFGANIDDRVQPQRPDLVASAVVPDYALGPHTASLGLAWAAQNTLPSQFRSGMFVGQHGSWNRRPASGYRVIFVPFLNGKPNGEPVDVLTGFIDGDDARGRPVGVAIDKRGALLVADDVGNAVWRVTSAQVVSRR